MRILVIGAIQGGTVPLGKSVADGFAANNQDVDYLYYSDLFTELNYIRQNPGDTDRAKDFFVLLKTRLLERIITFKPDVVFGISQSPLNDIEILSKIRQAGIMLCFWFTEDYKIFDYWKSIAPCFDHFFTIQREPFWQELAKIGSDNYHYLPLAFDESRRKAGSVPPDIDVSFMGAPYPNRVYYLPQIKGIKIYGDGWAKHQFPAVVEGKRRIGERKARQIYLKSLININLHSSVNKCDFGCGDFVNDRTFALAGLGAFQLTDMRRLLPLHFDLRDEIIAFADFADLQEAVKYFLKRKNERLPFIRKAKERVLKEHTYRYRIAEILRIIS